MQKYDPHLDRQYMIFDMNHLVTFGIHKSIREYEGKLQQRQEMQTFVLN